MIVEQGGVNLQALLPELVGELCDPELELELLCGEYGGLLLEVADVLFLPLPRQRR